MNHRSTIQRLACAVALSLSAASFVALAADATETTEIEILADGRSEKISIDDLAVGETRQLYSEAGTLVTATRTADTLELDVAGDRTSIRMLDPATLDDPEVLALLEAEGGEGESGTRRVLRIHADHAAHAGHEGADGKQRRVMVFSGKEGETHEPGEHGAHVLIDKAASGKHVIVKRRVHAGEGAAE